MMFSNRLIKLLLLTGSMTLPAVGFFIKEQDAIAGMDPNCPTVKHYTAEYHMDTVCDRASQNMYKDNLDRHAVRTRLLETGTRNVPSEKTSFCPQNVQALVSEDSVTGFDTSWIVENTASTPVVIAYMLQKEDGSFAEVSAFDIKISPPNHDPKAIMKPGEWKSLMTHEGHVFHVREILQDGSMGRVLMQHRVGLYPVTNRYGHELNCDPTDPDPEPVVVKEETGEQTRDPDFAREAPRKMRPCNVLDIGFRNEVGCPLNAYYTGMYQMKGVAKPRGNVTALKNGEAHTPKSCHEVFKFHLGKSDHPQDFMWSWDSKTKYESTFVGHNFVFRYAKDERIVVDSVALAPTQVIDCPGLKNQILAVSMSVGEAIVDTIGRREDFMLPHMSAAGINAAMMNGTAPALEAPATVPSRRTSGVLARSV